MSPANTVTESLGPLGESLLLIAGAGVGIACVVWSVALFWGFIRSFFSDVYAYDARRDG